MSHGPGSEQQGNRLKPRSALIYQLHMGQRRPQRLDPQLVRAVGSPQGPRPRGAPQAPGSCVSIGWK